MTTAFREGWRGVWALRRLLLLLYLCNLLFSVMVALPLRSWLKGAAGYSLALPQSIGQFDFTFITDLLRSHGDGLALVSVQMGVIATAYLLMSIFLMGGVLQCYVHHGERFVFKEFLTGSTRYFWRMLRLAVYFFILHILLAGVIIVIFLVAGIHPVEMESEMALITVIRITLPVYGCLALVIALTHTYVKIHVVEADAHPMTQAIWKGVGFVRRYFGSVVLLYLLNLLALALFFIGFLFLRDLFPMTNGWGIFWAFILGQIFLVARIGVKLMMLRSGWAMKKAIEKI